VLVALLGPTTAHAADDEVDERKTPLARLGEIQLLIEDVGAEGKACGLTRELIEEAFMYPVSSSRLRVVVDTDGTYDLTPTFYIKVLSGIENNRCYAYISGFLYSWELVTIFATKVKPLVRVELWQEGVLISGSAVSFTQHARTILERLSKRFVTEWNIENKTVTQFPPSVRLPRFPSRPVPPPRP
jgi:hypothetical protein